MFYIFTSVSNKECPVLVNRDHILKITRSYDNESSFVHLSNGSSFQVKEPIDLIAEAVCSVPISDFYERKDETPPGWLPFKSHEEVKEESERKDI